jgi:hypothetical protein
VIENITSTQQEAIDEHLEGSETKRTVGQQRGVVVTLVSKGGETRKENK